MQLYVGVRSLYQYRDECTHNRWSDGGRVAAAAETSAREAATIVRILAGERELFHDLIRPYERGLYVAAYSIVQNEADAEDIAQESVIKACKALNRFRGDAKLIAGILAAINLLLLWNENCIRRNPSAQWRIHPLTSRQRRGRWIQLATSVSALLLVLAEVVTRPWFHIEH